MGGPAGSLFPLEPRNEWTYASLRDGGERVLGVAPAEPGTFVLDGFPGARDLRVRWAGATLEAWDDDDRRWQPLLRLGAPAGTTYDVALPQPLWENVEVTVASTAETLYNPVLLRSHEAVVKLELRPDPGLADAGVLELWFEPEVGLVRWLEESFLGSVAHVLSRARVGGTTIG
jgi:hypothetical protein